MQPEAADVERVSRALGATPVAWRAASGHGAPSHRRFVVDLSGGRSAFVKIAAFDCTAGWLREEFRAYAGLDGQPFLPRMLGWDDDGLAPALALEDLSEATWPPPWDAARIDAVLATLASVHATPPPEAVPPAVESQFGMDGWPDVAADPEPFLSLGLCSREWLLDHLSALADASAAAEIEGTSFLHFDVRSDNLCLRDGRAVLVDWNNACVGNALLDIASWLPSLEAEGGPAPHVTPRRDARTARHRLATGRLLLRARRSAGDPAGTPRTAAAAHAVEDGSAVGGSIARPPSPDLTARRSLHLQHTATIRVVDSPYADLMDQLRSRGLRMTPQRRAIVSEVMRAKGHISPTAIARRVQGDMPGVNASTVYRTLTLLESVGVLQHSHVETGAEYHRADEAHHVHLTCRNCGQDDELSLEEADKLQGLIRRHHGFVADLTHFAITGLCKECAAA